MQEEEDFIIEYKGNKIKASSVINGGNIYFVIHFPKPIIIAEGLVNESWVWYEVENGETPLAAELGAIIEAMDL